MATTNRSNHNGSRELEQEIAHTRWEMDRTLNEIGDRLHPKHLLDEAMDLFRSDSGSRAKARQVLDQAACKVRQHPGPALLGAAAVFWYMMQDDQPATPTTAPRRHRTMTYAAWEPGYDWSTSQQDEQSWSERARQSLEDMRRVVGDSATSAKDKIRSLAGSMIGVSGYSREELRDRIHSQWADLREHSGSFVDARTGEPYDQSYGEQWSTLEGCHYLVEEEAAEQEGWGEKAQQTLSHISESLSSTGGSIKDQLKTVGSHLSSLGSGARSAAGRSGRAAGDRVRHMAHSTGEGMRSMAQGTGDGISRGAANVQHGMQQGYRYTRDQLSETFQQNPIAAGAACLGLGLLAGLLLPSTRRENELMGEASDDLKERAIETGKEALERGQQVASAAAGAATEEAQRQGLTPERMGEAIRQTAAASTEAARQEMPSKEEIEQKAGFASGSSTSKSGSTSSSSPGSSFASAQQGTNQPRTDPSRTTSIDQGPACDI